MIGRLHEKKLALARVARRTRRQLLEEGKEDLKKEEENEEGEKEVPPLLQALFPELKNGAAGEIYRRCKDEPAFMQKRVKVCEDCFLKHAEVACEHIVRQASSQHQSQRSSQQSRRGGGSGSKGSAVARRW